MLFFKNEIIFSCFNNNIIKINTKTYTKLKLPEYVVAVRKKKHIQKKVLLI